MQYNKYIQSKIYKLVNSIDNEIYIGSTIDNLNDRYNDHKSNSKRHPKRKLYSHCNLIGWENVSIILISSFPCLNKYELENEEYRYINLLNPSLNNRIKLRISLEERNDFTDLELIALSKKKYFEENKQHLTQKQLEYKEKNKIKILEWRNKKINCKCGKQVINANILRHNQSKFHLKNIET